MQVDFEQFNNRIFKSVETYSTLKMATAEDSFQSDLLQDFEALKSATGDASKCKIVFSDFRQDSKKVESTSVRLTKLATVTLDDDGWIYCVKIQMTSEFPAELPMVLVKLKRRASSNADQQSFSMRILEFSAKLTNDIARERETRASEKGYLGEMYGFLSSIIHEVGGESRLQVQPDNGRGQNTRKSRGKKQTSDKEQESDSKQSKKKPPMKTSTDVINRLIWEDAVSLDRVRRCEYWG